MDVVCCCCNELLRLTGRWGNITVFADSPLSAHRIFPPSEVHFMRSLASRCISCIVLFTLFLSPAAGQEWSRFRGPNGTGESETNTIPASWTDNELNWRVVLPGIGHSSPVLWGEKIFLLSADPTSAERYVLCLNAKDGKEIWRRTYPGVQIGRAHV